MDQPVVVGLGEVLWDMFPTGPRFGGAPANFACAAVRLLGQQASVEMVSAVGADSLGRQAIESLQSQGVGTAYVQVGQLDTGQVLVQLDEQGQATYRFADEQAWDEIRWDAELEILAKNCAVVCFGTLAQRHPVSRATVQRFVATAAQAYRILDLNIRQPYFSVEVALEGLRMANVVKLNEEELPVVAELIGASGSWPELGRQVQQHFALRYLAITRGAEGAWLLSADDQHFAPAPVVEVANTVGAGDTYTAACVAGILAGHSVAAINQSAVEAASEVCRAR